MKTDAEIQKAVMEELKWEPILNATEIGVAVKNGVVTLSGTLNTYWKKVVAEKAAKRVKGVKAVAEDIEVKLSVGGKRNDSEVAATVINALRWHSAMQDEKIQVKVEDGWVTLEGEVEWEFQRSAARTMVQDLTGVVGIINNVKVVSSIKPLEVKQKIMAAFHRNATIDAEHIKIDVTGTRVILKGTVRSYAEKRQAEKAAWLAPGVEHVENELVVERELVAF